MSNKNIESNKNDKSEKNNKKQHTEKPIHYFNKVIKNMDNKEFSKLKVIYKTEISMEFSDFDEQLIKNHIKNYEMEEYFKNSDSLSWLEFLENKELYIAMKKLKIKDVILLHMWINQKYTQKEIAECIGSTRKVVNKRLIKIRKDLRKNLNKS